MSRPGLRAAAAALGLLATAGSVVACSSGDDSPATPPTQRRSSTTASTAPPVARDDGSLDAVGLSVAEIARVEEPTAIAFQSASPTLFVAERAGRVRRIEVTVSERTGARTFQLQTTPALDISDEVVTTGEFGLLGITFSPDGRRLYVSYSRAPDGDTQIDEYRTERFRADDIDTDSRRAVLTVDQPRATHNGGDIHFGPDGFLYLGLGDDRTGDDDSDGQDLDTLRGKLLRIDPERPDGERAYGIPDGNPFADGDDGEPEIFLYGVRNPWRFSFDRETGDLWIADVGQSAWEEVNRLRAGDGGGVGANLGWNAVEGTHVVPGRDAPAGAVRPIHEYGRDAGCSVIGGYVYRGAVVPGLVGTYVFADYCRGGLRGLKVDDDGIVDQRTWPLPIGNLVSLGEGDDGELYALSQDGPVYRILPGEGEPTTTTERVDIN